MPEPSANDPTCRSHETIKIGSKSVKKQKKTCIVVAIVTNWCMNPKTQQKPRFITDCHFGFRIKYQAGQACVAGKITGN